MSWIAVLRELDPVGVVLTLLLIAVYLTAVPFVARREKRPRITRIPRI